MLEENKPKGVQLAVALLLLTNAVLPNDISQSTSMLNERTSKSSR